MATKAEKLLKKGRAQQSKGNHLKAWKSFRSACDHAKHDPQVWLARADMAVELQETEDAVESLFYLADLYVRSGMSTEALATAERVLELDPNHGGARRFKSLLIRKVSESDVSGPADPHPDPPPQAGEGADPDPDPVPDPVPDPDPDPDPVPDLAPAPVPDSTPALVEIEEEPGPPAPEEVVADFDRDDAYEVVIDRAQTDSGRVAKPVPRGRSKPYKAEYTVGRVTGNLALAELSLGDRLTSRRPRPDTGEIEIEIDDEDDIDIVRAVAATVTSSPLLSELDSDLVKHLVDAGNLQHRAAGDLVFAEGETGTSLYLILKGRVAVEREGDNGEPHRLAVLRPGAFFGEMALLTNGPRSASVRAIDSVDLLEISREAVRALVDKDARVLKLLMRFFRARLVGTLMATSPLFDAFTRDQKRRLISQFRLRELRAGHLVLKTGERSEGLYLVLVGQLQVFSGGAISDPKVLGTLGPGDVFGEMSLLDGKGAMANVRTQGRSWVLLLPRDDFAELISTHPAMLEQLAAIADQRRTRNEDLLARGGVPESTERVEPI
jgi:cAMP-dependent protein kinase regulator